MIQVPFISLMLIESARIEVGNDGKSSISMEYVEKA